MINFEASSNRIDSSNTMEYLTGIRETLALLAVRRVLFSNYKRSFTIPHRSNDFK